MSRLGAVLCVFVLLVLFPLQAEAVLHGCTNEPTGSTLLTDWAFNSLSGGGWGDAGGNHRIGTDATAPISPSNVYQQVFYNGMPGGISPANDYFLFSPVREVYLCFWWKANAGWQAHPAGINKILFVSREDGGNPFFLIMSGQDPYNLAFSYQEGPWICNDHLTAYPGICGTALWQGGVALVPGNWYRIELYIKMSTTTTSRDGIFRWWANGALAGDLTTANTDTPRLASVPIVPIWGGTGGTKTQEDIFSYDHIVVSTPSGGSPPTSTDIPAGPPGQVTGTTFTVGGVQ